MTEQDFEARILQELNSIDAARRAQARRDAFQEVLERFARALSRHPALGAKVEATPAQLRLVLWPKLRRDELVQAKYFSREGDGLVVWGVDRKELRSPDELEEYLSRDYLRDPQFMERLSDFEARCATPALGFLRRGGPNEAGPEDVLVHVAPDEQRRLAEAAPGHDLTLLAREDRMPLTSLYDSGKTYTCLVAGGYGMWAKNHSRAEDERLRIAGPAMREDEFG